MAIDVRQASDLTNGPASQTWNHKPQIDRNRFLPGVSGFLPRLPLDVTTQTGPLVGAWNAGLQICLFTRGGAFLPFREIEPSCQQLHKRLQWNMSEVKDGRASMRRHEKKLDRTCF